MTQAEDQAPPTHYQVLHVHPGAPLDLVTAAYWRLTGLVQSAPGGKAAEVALYHLTRAYQVLADHRSRETYDQALGLNVQSTPRVPLTRRSSWIPFSSRHRDEVEPDISIDYYEVMRLDSAAHPAVVGESYAVMRNYYLRLAEQGQARPELVDLLEEAYDVLSNPAQRLRYDSSRGNKRLPYNVAVVEENADLVNEEDINDKNAVATAVAVRSEQEDAVDDALTEQNSVTANDDAGATDSQQAGEARPAGSVAAEQTTNNGRIPAPRLWRRRGRPAQVEEEAPVGMTATDGAALRERPTVRALRALAATSGKLLVKGGRESAHLAVLSSRALKELMEPQRREQNGAETVEEEEEAVLGRLFVTVADHSRPESAPEPRPLARLTVYDGEAAAVSYDVCKVPLTLGEDDACDIKLAGLAPRQARLLYHGGQFVLHALTDDPTARLNGDVVTWALLRDGDSVEVGPYHLRFSLTQ